MTKKWIGIYCIGIAFMFIMLTGTHNVIQVMADSSEDVRVNCIILDAGHGFPDGGALSCTGVPECEINLQITRRLEALLQILGYKTKMIRTEADSIYTQGETIAQKKVSDLKERVRIVNETPGAVLLSIHQNTFKDERYSGAQVFYAPTDGSDDLSHSLQKNLVSALMPESSRKSKPSQGVYLMEQIHCTGVLIECGFISNPKEEAMLRDIKYQKKLCSIIATTMCAFLSDT